MKSPSPETTLNNSLLEWLANTANNSQAPSVLAPPTLESRAEERERLHMILNFAIALIDDSIFDFDPNDPNVPSASTTTSGQ
jgi:hypothetical protein